MFGRIVLFRATVLKLKPSCTYNTRRLVSVLRTSSHGSRPCNIPSITRHSVHPRALSTSITLYASVDPPTDTTSKKTSRKETRSNLARILREYGSVAVAFHLTMSLSVLSVCYLVVKSGVDVENFLKYFNIDSSRYSTASTFAVAYIIYKILLPLRATVTITTVPFIVRHLRARGYMKPRPPTTPS
jgi:hypothetical protein